MDKFEQRLRDAAPNLMSRYAPLSERAERELAVLLATPRSKAVGGLGPRRRVAMVTTIAAVVAVIVVVGAVTFLVPRPAAAAAPPLLETTPLNEPEAAILGMLIAMARTTSSATTSEVIASETWSAELTPESTATFVQPREVVRTREDNLSGSIITSAGTVRWGVATGVTPSPPGELLERFDYGPGEFPMLFPEPPPISAEALQVYLSRYVGLDENAPAGDLFRAIADMRNEWSLNGAQVAAVLELIRDRPGVTVLGTVTDRLGRVGVAVSTETRIGGTLRDLLIFDPATGRLLSAEDVYLGGIPDLELDPPIVMNYIAWKDSP